jgi:glycosyltransferase involved in cell wall biosynthesis
MRVALISYNAQAGDAIGNLVAEKLAFFLDRNADVRVFVENDSRLHLAIRSHCDRICLEQVEPTAWQFLQSSDLVVVEYGQYYGLLGLLPMLAGGKPRIVFDYHGITPPELWSGHNREAIEQGIHQCDRVWSADVALTHSRFAARELHRHTAFPPEHTRLLPHFVDRACFSPGVHSRYLHGRMGLTSGSILLFVGRLAPNKRVPVLVEALALLRNHTPTVHAVIIGDTSDLYNQEAIRCRQRAAELGVADRLHFLGHVSDEELRDAYRSADVFVMPSRHEGFCIPVLEAMASGLPVLAARSGALPETTAGAGLTFAPDDPADLARQTERILAPRIGSAARHQSPEALRVAIVSFRFGADFVGGAEMSLARIAAMLHQSGHAVEIFATCTRSESDWKNELSPGTSLLDGLAVQRFPIDAHDRAAHLDAVRAILEGDVPPTDEMEENYIANSIHSTALLQALAARVADLDAIIVGPYLFGLTLDVARAFPDKTILLPCFHNEPVAHLPVWPKVYTYVGSILYHSPEEKELAETKLGINHPRGVCLGSWIDTEARGNAERGQKYAGSEHHYLAYCGRYSVQKNVPLLLDYARRYAEQNPERFTFVFVGHGEVPIPRQPWVRDLGFVDEETKRDLLAGASALVQLSSFESLSLVALEAWAQGIPVLANADCSVLAGHLTHSHAGQAIVDFDSFAQALDDLWDRPDEWRARGEKGRQYVRSEFGDADGFGRKLVDAVRDLKRPIAEVMRDRGLQHVALHDRAIWRERFAAHVEEILDQPPRSHESCLVLQIRVSMLTARPGQKTLVIPVRVTNYGSDVVVPDGPARLQIRCAVLNSSGQQVLTLDTPLPALVTPGREVSVAVRVPVPDDGGDYRLRLVVWQSALGKRIGLQEPEIDLKVGDSANSRSASGCTPSLRAVQACLANAERRQQLPDDYLDVTEGRFARWKLWLKRKLLGNFKHAYVDVLSRQQSAFNREMVTALTELAECCTLLDQTRDSSQLVEELTHRLAESCDKVAVLEERLARLERSQPEHTEVPT